jgi:hypothetical protein
LRWLVVFCLLVATRCWGEALQPAKTWVFAVCCLEWQQSEMYPPFPKENRRDEQLVAAFRSLGVPSAQIVLLQDSKASLQGIRASYARLLEQTRPGDLLVVYYAGHGCRDEQTGFYMVPYDGNDYESLWSVDQLLSQTESGFRGDNVLVMADCCHSGSLARLARRANLEHNYAALASSAATTESTGNWTFSDRVLEALAGDPCADENGDGLINLQETGRFVSREMQFAEGQAAQLTSAADFPKPLDLRRTARSLRSGEGQLVKVLYEKELWTARVLERKGKNVRVRWLGTNTDYPDEVVPASSIRK